MSTPSASSTNCHFNFTVEQPFQAVIGGGNAVDKSEDLRLFNQSAPLVFGRPRHFSELQCGYDFPSSCCNLFPNSAHFEHLHRTTKQLKRSVRRPNWNCPECRRCFDNLEQFQAHFEPCWAYAVEREIRQQPTTKRSAVPDGPLDESTLMCHCQPPYQRDVDGEEIHFDGNPALMRSKSGGISLFVALESQLKAKRNSFNGNAKKTIIENHFDSCGVNFEPNSNELSENKAMTAKFLLEKVECPVCGKRLFRHNLHVHHRIHTGELPFPCAFCPKRFRTSSARRVHHRSHTGEKPYLCTFCHYSCSTKRNLERHVHNRHLSIRTIARN